MDIEDFVGINKERARRLIWSLKRDLEDFIGIYKEDLET